MSMIYFDHNSTTTIDDRVKHYMISLMDQPFNPSSIHNYGRKAKAIIENARQQVMDLVGVNNKEYKLIFTSSGTESNNLVLHNFKDADIFISATEHLSILISKNYLPNVKLIKVHSNGIIDLEDLEDNLKKSNNPKKLLSVMYANNETGVIQPLAKIIKIAKNYGALIHSDLVQAIGKIEINIRELDLDFGTISAHKFGGPLGAGALILKVTYDIKPMINGGGQEKNMRGGSENVIAIAGFGKAAELAATELTVRYNKMKLLQDQLEQNLPEKFVVVAANTLRLSNTSMLIAKNFSAQNLLIALDLKNIMVSSGSACSSGKIGKSHVLAAMNYSDEEAKSAIRVSLSHHNTKTEIEYFIQICNELEMRKTA